MIDQDNPQALVRLISITTPLIDEAQNAEELIVYCARVSSPQNQGNQATGTRLLNYCAKKGHWSIFEMIDATVEIVTSRAIAAQILRHRSFSFQEFSQRYAEATDFVFSTEARTQDTKNRQGSNPAPELNQLWQRTQNFVRETCEHAYQTLLDAGVAREQARLVLPLSTATKIYMKGSLRSWIHYLQTRTAPETQLEHREIAHEILTVLRPKFPRVFEAFFPTQNATTKDTETA